MSAGHAFAPATAPRADPSAERLLVIEAQRGEYATATVGELPRWLGEGDLLVVNDAATLPASLPGRGPHGEPIELRLLEAPQGDRAQAVLFGAGSWRDDTDHRPAPPIVSPGEQLTFEGELTASVEAVSPEHSRWLTVRFSPGGDGLFAALYRAAAPVQYSYLSRPLALWDVQTSYAGRPWAVEMPSAGRPLRWSLLMQLAARGVKLARVTHAAGLSATGDARLDAELPLPERWSVPQATVDAVKQARRVIAAGTSVVRALESSGGTLTAGEGVTELKLGPHSRLEVTHGILTGLHEPKGSHWALLGAFAPEELLQRAHRHARQAGWLGHEFGDSCLILT